MSKNPLAWKFILIAVVIGVAFLFSFPPKERINLGLDLKGGAHYLMQVQTDTAIKFEMDRVQNSLGQRFKADEIVYQAILPAGEAALEIRGTSPDQRPEIRSRPWSRPERASSRPPTGWCKNGRRRSIRPGLARRH